MTRNKKTNVPLILAALAIAAGGFYYVKKRQDKKRAQELLTRGDNRQQAAQGALGAIDLLPDYLPGWEPSRGS